MRTPTDKILVKLDRAFNDEIKTSSGLVLFQDTSYSPEQHVTIQGEVIAIPDKLSSDPFKKDIVPEVEVGDTLFFSYTVVFDRDSLDDPEALYEVEENSWRNQNGFELKMAPIPAQLSAMMTGKSIWVGVYTDPEGEMVDMYHGKKSEVESWLTQFRFTQRDEMRYTNLLFDNIWVVDYQWAIMAKRDGKYIPIGGYVMIEPTVIDLSLTFSDGTNLILPEYMKKAVKVGEGKVLAIGTPKKNQVKLGIEEGDVIIYNPRYAEKYVIDGKEVDMVKSHKIYGKAGNS